MRELPLGVIVIVLVINVLLGSNNCSQVLEGVE
jgi:hypothetical protein